jgi:hypothetical protein
MNYQKKQSPCGLEVFGIGFIEFFSLFEEKGRAPLLSFRTILLLNPRNLMSET